MADNATIYLLRAINYGGQVLKGETRIDGELVEEGQTVTMPLSMAAEMVHARKARYVIDPTVAIAETKNWPTVTPEPAPELVAAESAEDQLPAAPVEA